MQPTNLDKQIEQTRDDAVERLDKFVKKAEEAQALLARITNQARASAKHLRDGKPAGRTAFVGVTDLAANVNTLSRWEGRISDTIDLAFDLEQQQEDAPLLDECDEIAAPSREGR